MSDVCTVLHALNHPTRRAIMSALTDRDQHLRDLGLDIAPQLLSFHLDALKAAGLVERDRRRGHNSTVRLASSKFTDLVSLILSFDRGCPALPSGGCATLPTTPEFALSGSGVVAKPVTSSRANAATLARDRATDGSPPESRTARPLRPAALLPVAGRSPFSIAPSKGK